MKKRIGIFETNSSSTHSISFNPWQAGRDGNDFVPWSGDGKIHVNGGEFGWDWRGYNGSTEKANYYLERYKDYPDRLELLRDVIKEYTGIEAVTNDGSDGYIDHQSFDELDLPEGDKEAVKNFLFNPDVWVYTGNDNSDEPMGLKTEEWEGLPGDHVVTTIEFSTGDILDFRTIGFPNEENLGQVLDNVDLGDYYYDLKSMDLEKNEIVMVGGGWGSSPDEITGKIIKIKSDELGEVIP